MAGTRFAQHIDAPPEAVFARSIDFARLAERARGVQRVELLTDGPVGVGTRFRETRSVPGGGATEVLEVTAFDPPRSFVLGSERRGCRCHTELSFVPNAAGTDVVVVFEAEPRTWRAKLRATVSAPGALAVARECVADLDDLKRVCEEKRGASA